MAKLLLAGHVLQTASSLNCYVFNYICRNEEIKEQTMLLDRCGVRFLGKRTSLNIGCFCVPEKNSWLPQRLTLGHRFFIWIHSIEQTNMSSVLKVQRKTGLSNPRGVTH